jgi:hypothetical protein
LHFDAGIVRHSGIARLFAVLLIVLGSCPFTAPFQTCELTDHGGALHSGWKAPTDPDDVLSLPVASHASHLPFTAAELAECIPVGRLPTHRLPGAVLRL